MSTASPDPVAKVHPASREMLPDDPLDLQAFEVPGDAELMLRLLAEEYARLGMGTPEILGLARDPFYVALHGLWQCFGEKGLRERVTAVLSRVGVSRVRIVAAPAVQELVQIELPESH